MCGINFIIDKKGVLDDRPIQSMVESISHRGQDFQSVYKHSHHDFQVFFGANRLNIIDRDENSNQPFIDKEKSAILLFNGEIYNFFDLKNELINLGYQFRTQSDTEVLFYWIKEFGRMRLHELEGMFAFVYFDLQNDTFLCARDRFGIKPLYYFENDNFLLLASEIRALTSSNIFQKQLNEHAIPHYLLYRYAPAPETFIKNVFQFPKANYAESAAPWRLTFKKIEEEVFDRKMYDVSEYKEALKESVLQQLFSSAGIGVMLSGGIDSSLITALAHEEGQNLPCFSIFTRENKREKELAANFARKRFLHHELVEIDDTILDQIDQYVDILDQPISDSAGLLTFHLSQHAASFVKILLSGAGGDELFAGYNRHSAFNRYLAHKSQWLLLKKLVSPLIANKSYTSGYVRFINQIEQDPQATFLRFSSWHFSEWQGRLEERRLENDGHNDHLLWALEFDRNNYLVNDVLSISDIASMSAGIEMRVPFLDNKLVNLVRRTDSKHLLSKGPKWILKEMLREYTSKKHINMQKTGFGLPLKEWFQMKDYNHLWDLFQNKNSVIFNFLDRSFITQLIQSHQNRKQDHTQTLWSLITLGHWLNKEFL